MKKKKLMIEEEDKSDKTKFCTECGDTLDDFAITDNAKDVQKVKDNFENCKKTGKFKGEECSKLFIASKLEDLPYEDEDF
jgi:hypothetical protein